MAKTALALFNSNGAVAIPDHIQKFMDETRGNIAGRETVPSLSYGGKVWTIGLNGEKTKLTKRNDDGDEEPRQIMRVVILDYGKRRGRAYYEGAYDPDKPGAPVCWSEDGAKPHDNVTDKQCTTCAACPMAVKGSKVSDNGKATKACSEHRMLAVVPANDLSFTPLRLKLAITSDWDANSPDLEAKGWRAFQNYADSLKANGVQHTATLVTKMKFDPGVDYPKVIFSADRWLESDEIAQIVPIAKGEAVKTLLNATWTPAGADGVKNEGVKEDPRPNSIKAKAARGDEDEEETPAPKAKAKAKPAPVDEDEEEAPAPKAKAKAKPAPVEDDEEEAPAPKAKVATKAKAKAAPVEDDEDESPAPKAKAKATGGDVPADVSALLEEWGED